LEKKQSPKFASKNKSGVAFFPKPKSETTFSFFLVVLFYRWAWWAF
jgi:hypothetical protein